VAADASHLYWAIATDHNGDPNAGTIDEANLDGSSPHAVVTGQDLPDFVAVGP
jgi:hypothetical protein